MRGWVPLSIIGLSVLSAIDARAASTSESSCSQSLNDYRARVSVEDRWLYIDRKKVSDADAVFKIILAHWPQPGLRPLILDFSLKRAPDLARANLIDEIAASRMGRRGYDALSAAERERFVFKPFLRSLLDPKTPAAPIHIDHHYPYLALANTSATPLITDFTAWLIGQTQNQTLLSEPAEAALALLSNSFSVLDHTDPDIVLSHYVARNAHRKDWILRYGPLLKDVALFNDHMVENDARSKRYRAEVRVLFYIMQSLEYDLADESIAFPNALEKVTQGLQFIDFLRAKEDDQSLELDRVLARMNPLIFPESRRDALQRFQKYQAAYEERAALLRELEAEALDARKKGLFEIVPDQIPSMPERSIRKVGSALVTYLPDSAPFPDASVVKQYLKSVASPLIANARIVFTSCYDPRVQARFLKVRSLLPEMKLARLYDALEAAGFEAGGRASAGTAAYGKAGARGLAPEQALSDLQAVIRVYLDSTNAD